MGQVQGVPIITDRLQRFTNLPKEGIESLFLSFNLQGDNWGVDAANIRGIFSNASKFAKTMNFSDDDINNLFISFDTDFNSKVDVLEMILSLALVSGMDIIEKIQFMFCLYDFESNGSLSFHELSLLIQSVVISGSKVFPTQTVFSPLTLSEVEKYSSLVYDSLNKSNDNRITIGEFQQYCITHPVTKNWLHYFSSFPSIASEKSSSVSRSQILVKQDFMTKSSSISLASNTFNRYTDASYSYSSSTNSTGSDLIWFPMADRQLPDNYTDNNENDDGSSDNIADGNGGVNSGTMMAGNLLQNNPPEDVFTPTWIHGFNCDIKFRGIPAFYTSQSNIIYSASRHILSLIKDEESHWTQTIVSYHQQPIITMAYSSESNILVTADWSDTNSKIFVWDSVQYSLMTTITMSTSRQTLCMAVNSIGNKLVTIVEEDGNALLTGYYLNGQVFFSTILNEKPSDINGVSFFGTSSMIAIVKNTGIMFYIDEGSISVGKNDLIVYERRSPLYHTFGSDLMNKSMTTLCRFENPDELLVGTETGRLILWRSRSVIQSIQVNNQGLKVISLHYNEGKQMALCLCADGILSIINASQSSDLFSQRLLKVMTTINVTYAGMTASSLRSAVSSVDGSKALITTTVGEIHEISLIGDLQRIISSDSIVPVVLKTEKGENEEGEDGDDQSIAARPEEVGDDNGDDSEEQTVLRQGDNLNAGPVVACHQSSSSSSSTIKGVVSTLGGFITFSSDGYIRQWSVPSEDDPSLSSHKQLRTIPFDSGIVALGISSTQLAVALDGTKNINRLGEVMIFKLPDMTFVVELTDIKGKDIIDIKFSMDGNSLVVLTLSGDHYIYYVLEDTWTLKKTFISNGLIRCDISEDCQFIRAQATNDRLVFIDIFNDIGNEVYDAEILKPVVWATTSCPYAWDTKGLFNQYDSTNENSMIYCITRSNNLLVSSEAGSNGIRVIHVPSPIYNSSIQNSTRLPSIHIQDVSGCTFVNDGKYLVTVGNNDGLVVVWNVVMDNEELTQQENGLDENQVESDDEEEDNDDDDSRVIHLPKIVESGTDDDLIDGIDMQSHISNSPLFTETLAWVNNWANSIDMDVNSLQRNQDIVPTNQENDNNSNTIVLPPEYDLSIDWIYGYSCRLTRNSVKYSSDGFIVYPAGSIAIAYDKIKTKQILSCHHSDEITCLDMNSTGDIFATGQRGNSDIFVCVWKIISGRSVFIQRLNCGCVNGISALAFNPEGNLLIIATQDNDHTIIVYDWKNNLILGKIYGGQKKILNITCSLICPSSNTLLRAVCGTPGGYFLLTVSRGSLTLSRTTGLFGMDQNKRTITCSVALPAIYDEDGQSLGGSEFIVGLTDGSIGIVNKDERIIDNYIPIQSGSITSMTTSIVNGTLNRVITGGVNGYIKILDSDFQVLQSFNLYKPSKDLGRHDHGLNTLGRAKGFRSLAVDKYNRKIVYGTAAGEIGEIDFQSGLNMNSGPLVESHFRYGLQGLATHPIRMEFATAGDDKTIRTWSVERHKVLNQIDLPNFGKSLCYSPNGQLIVVGMSPSNDDKGTVAIVSYLQGDLRIVYTAKDALSDVTCVAFIPDGSKLFAASNDGNIYVYNALDNFKLMKTLSNHTESVIALDISLDGKTIVSYGNIFELFVWEVSTLSSVWNKEITPKLLKTKEWFVRKGCYNSNLVGITSSGNIITNSSALNHLKTKGLVVSGDNFGGLKLFRYPSINLQCPFKSYQIHSRGGVSGIECTNDEECLLSIGKSDRLIVSWKLTKSSEQSEPITSNSNTSAITTTNATTTTVVYPYAITTNADTDSDITILGDFDSSFTVKTVNFLQSKQVISTNYWSSISSVSLSNVIGVNIKSTGTNNNFQSPNVFYSGIGDITACYSRFIGVLDHNKTSIHCIQPELDSFLYKSYSIITSATISNCRKYIAVGTVDNYNVLGNLLIIDALTYKVLSILSSSGISNGVTSVAFSHDSKSCACIANDWNHTLYVFQTPSTENWNEADLIYSGFTTASEISLLSFIMKTEFDINVLSQYDIAVAGKNIIKFISITGKNMISKTEIFEGVITAITAIPYSGIVITGDNAGNVTMWKNGSKEQEITKHLASVSALTCFDSQIVNNPVIAPIVLAKPLTRGLDQKLFTKGFNNNNDNNNNRISKAITNIRERKYGIVSGSLDVIRIYNISDDLSFNMIREISMSMFTTQLPSSSSSSSLLSSSSSLRSRIITTKPYVTRLSTDPLCTRLLVAGTDNRVIEITVDSGSVSEVIKGEDRSIQCLVAHPTDESIVVTVTIDNSLNILNLRSNVANKIAGQLKFNSQVTCIRFTSETKLLVGLKDTDMTGNPSGSVVVIDLVGLQIGQPEKREVIMSVQHRLSNIGNGGVTDVKFSPDHKLLVTANEDGSLYFYTYKDNVFEKENEFPIHSTTIGSVDAVDFSTDGKYLRTFSKCYSGDRNVVTNYLDVTITEEMIIEATKKNTRPFIGFLITEAFKLCDIRDRVHWSTMSSPAISQLRVIYDSRIRNSETNIVSLSVSSDQTVAVVGNSDGRVRLYNLSSSETTNTDPLNEIISHSNDGAMAVFLSGQKNKVCTCGVQDGTIMVWDLQFEK